MIYLIQIAVFVAAFLGDQKWLMIVIAIGNLFVPDEMAALDEIIMLVMALRALFRK